MPHSQRAFLTEFFAISVIVFASAQASRWLGAPDQGVSILWPPAALMLGYCFHQGLRPLLGAALGISAWALLNGFSVFSTVMIAMATTVPPAVTTRLLVRRLGDSLDLTTLKTTIQIIVTGLGVHAPLCALLGTAAMSEHPLAQASLPFFFSGYYLVEATSGLVFISLGLLWNPKYAERAAKQRPTLWLRFRSTLDPISLAYVFAVGAASVLADANDFGSLAGLLIYAAILGPLFSSITRPPRMSSVTLPVAAAVMLCVRAYLYRSQPHLLVAEGLVPAWLVISVAAIFLHLLNALSVERWRNNKRVQASAMRSEIPGLISARAFHQVLDKLTTGTAEKPLRVIEIFVPEVLRAGELMGRTAMLELELAAATRLNELAGNRLKAFAHLSTGRFAILASSALNDSRLLRLVSEALQSHSFKIGGRLFQLRPAIGLIDVPMGTKSHPEAILAALSMAQQRAFTSAERFQKFPLGSRELKEVWAALDLEESVKHALHEKRIRLMGQLIAPCQLGNEDESLHYEILARMLDEKGNVVSPTVFLPAIARAGLTREFDRLVIKETFDYLQKDPTLAERTRVCAINVTGRTICSPELPALIREHLARTGLSPRMFAIEITESESIEDIEAAKANAHQLASMGLTVAVDDFGTGLATFDYLKQFKPQMLKIDGSFIRNFDDSPLDRAIVQSIVRVSSTIGATTVAEWVETEDLARQLRGLGVDFLQGYAISKPLPIEQISSLQAKPDFLKPQADTTPGTQPLERGTARDLNKRKTRDALVA